MLLADIDYLQNLRRFVGHDFLFSPGVSVIILDDSDNVLLGYHRTLHVWTLPAGSMELGESLMQTVMREVREETSLQVVQSTPFALYSSPKYNTVYPNGDQVQPVTAAFHASVWEGDLRADKDEILELRFFSIYGVLRDEDVHPPHRKTVEDFIAFRDYGHFTLD
jgi:ADP-ribose pyrophosphatase YjhB (NUDIX family)